MSTALMAASWPVGQVADALDALAQRSGLSKGATIHVAPLAQGKIDLETFNRWLEGLGTTLGVEIEPVETPYPEVARLISRAAPALFRIPMDGGGTRFLALLGGNRRTARALAPDGRVVRLPVSLLRTALTSHLEGPQLPGIDELLDEARVPGRRRTRARSVMLLERLRSTNVDGVWLLRLPPSAGFFRHVRQEGLFRKLALVVFAHAVQYLLVSFAWWLVGKGALEGRLDEGWLLAWALVLLTTIPFRLWELWMSGLLAIGAGALLKLRLLYGSLRLNPEEIRHQGAGQLLGRVIESEAVESLALGAGFSGLVAIVELVFAAVVLSLGAGGAWHTVLFLAWTAVTGWFCWRYFWARNRWTEARVDMTNDLVERMVGHRTRVAQERRSHWHEGEDQALERYLNQSADLDKTVANLSALVPRGWMILALLGLVPSFVWGQPQASGIAVTFGGILLGFRALGKVVGGLVSLAGAIVAWKQIAPLFLAAGRVPDPGAPTLAALTPRDESGDGQPLVQANDIVFRYPGRGAPILRGTSLDVARGDRLLLEGPSGGGKSTLASLITGIREPESGLLLLRGFDRRTLGEAGWRQRVVSAPQFHENHVLTETFAFNLLMGRRWPPEQGDTELALAICKELGLGDLLQRMPAGLLQMVGETGWQLSHGEKSRLYIARALLQRTDIIVLDESFASLDPETMRRALHCVLKRAPTLLVIAHP